MVKLSPIHGEFYNHLSEIFGELLGLRVAFYKCFIRQLLDV